MNLGWSLAIVPRLMDPPKGPVSKEKPLEDEVEPFGDEADPEHRNAHPARRIVGRGEVEQKEALGVAQKGDPEPHVLQPGQLVLQRLGHRDARAQRGLHGDSRAGAARV